MDEQKNRFSLPSDAEWLASGGAIEHSTSDSPAIVRVDNWQEVMTKWLSKWQEKNRTSEVPEAWRLAYSELNLGGGYIPIEHTTKDVEDHLSYFCKNPAVVKQASKFILALTEPTVQHVTTSEFKSGESFPSRE